MEQKSARSQDFAEQPSNLVPRVSPFSEKKRDPGNEIGRGLGRLGEGRGGETIGIKS